MHARHGLERRRPWRHSDQGNYQIRIGIDIDRRDREVTRSRDLLGGEPEYKTLSGSFTSYRIYSHVPILIEAFDESYGDHTRFP